MVKAVRGATTVESDKALEIDKRVLELVDSVFKLNNIGLESVVSINFSITDDLVSKNPAAALRSGGKYSNIPLFCAQEPKSEGALKMAIRILVTFNSLDGKVVPVYLHGAKVLRPDLIN